MQFFVLTNPVPGSPQDKLVGTEALSEDDSNSGEAPHCTDCGQPVGMLAWLPPFRVELKAWGREYGDLCFMPAGELLVSLRFRKLWEESRLVGLSEFDAVEVIKVKRRRKLAATPPQYFKVNVIRSQAAVDQTASGAEWTHEPEICHACRLNVRKGASFMRRKGIVIEPQTWTGEDIFIPRGASEFIVSSRFKEFCEKHEVTNAVISAAETHECDHYPSTAKIMLPILRRWEDKSETPAERRDAYGTLSFWIYPDRSRQLQGKFDPDRDIDPSIIEQARQRIRAELGAV